MLITSPNIIKNFHKKRRPRLPDGGENNAILLPFSDKFERFAAGCLERYS
jgi:hypothetical protein